MNKKTNEIESYFPVHPNVIRIGTQCPFSIYKNAREGAIELFHPPDEIYSDNTHRKIFFKLIPRLYIRKKDKIIYYEYLEKFLPSIIENPFIPLQIKAEVSYESLTVISMHLFDDLTAEKILHFRKMISLVVDLALNTKHFFEYLLLMTESNHQDYNHFVNVGIYGMGLAMESFSTPAHNLEEISLAYFLHDIGKCIIPKHIIEKKGKLNNSEWEIIKKHPEEGYKILKKYKLLTKESGIVTVQHHERYDGSGYPYGFKNDKIHLYSKICALADTFDALSSKRQYHEAKTPFNAISTMKKEMKNEFDDVLLKKFILLFSKASKSLAKKP